MDPVRQITIQQLLVILFVVLLPLIDLLRGRKQSQTRTEDASETELDDGWREEQMPEGVSVPIPERTPVEHLPIPVPQPQPEPVRVEYVPRPVVQVLPHSERRS